MVLAQNKEDPLEWGIWTGNYNFIVTTDALEEGDQKLFFDEEPCFFISEVTSMAEIINELILVDFHFISCLKQHDGIESIEIPKGFNQWKFEKEFSNATISILKPCTTIKPAPALAV